MREIKSYHHPEMEEANKNPNFVVDRVARFTHTLSNRTLIPGSVAIGAGLILLAVIGDDPEGIDKARSIQDAKNNGAGFSLNIPEIKVSLPEERIAQASFNIEQAERVIRGGSNNSIDNAILRKAQQLGYTFDLFITTSEEIVLDKPARVYRIPVPGPQVPSDELDNLNVIAVLPKDMKIKIEGVVGVGNIYSAQKSNYGLLSPQYRVYADFLGAEANRATQWIQLP